MKPYRKVHSAWASGPAEKHYRIHPSEWFADSCFGALGEILATERRQVTIADLIGRALSRSNTSPETPKNFRVRLTTGSRWNRRSQSWSIGISAVGFT